MMVTTPDSIPSLGEISRDSTDADDVSRVLFQTPEHEFTEVALGYSQSQFVGEDDKDSLFGSDISIATVGDNTLGYGRTGRFSLPSPLRPEFDDNENPRRTHADV